MGTFRTCELDLIHRPLDPRGSMSKRGDKPCTPELREAVVRSVLEEGLSRKAAARRFHVAPASIDRWVKRYRLGGIDWLQDRQDELTDEQITAIIEEARTGVSYKIIADRWLVSEATICRFAVRCGIRRNPKPFTQEQKQSLYAVMKHRTTQFCVLARFYDVSNTTIARYAKAMGIKPPTRQSGTSPQYSRRPLTEKEKQLCALMMRRTTPFYELARLHKIQYSKVRYLAKKMGIKPPSRLPTRLTRWKMLSLKQQKNFLVLASASCASYSEIGIKFGFSKETASILARKFGIHRGQRQRDQPPSPNRPFYLWTDLHRTPDRRDARQ